MASPLQSLLMMVLGSHLQELTASCAWIEDKADLHINVLETRAVLLSLHAFQESLVGHTVVLISDNAVI